MHRSSRSFRASFPAEEPGFRSAAWQLGVPTFGESLTLLSATTVAALERTARIPDLGVRFYPDDAAQAPRELSYAALLARVRQYGGALRRKGVRSGDRVLLVLPTSHEFLIAFFACQWLGAIPVPSYPPATLERVGTALDRLVHIGNHSSSRCVVTSTSLRTVLGDLALRVKSLEHLFVTDDLERGEALARAESVDESHPCFIQYTSGSTGNPKGVLLTHRNVTSNMHAIGLGFELTRADRLASWLPLYHDMGLIGGILAPIYWSVPIALLSPMAFLFQPLRWLKMIEENASTISPAPNFAYALLVKRTREEERAALDLSSWRVALTGAEPVNVRTVREFCSAFAVAKFSPRAILPAYGLAESALALCFSKPGSPLRSVSLNRAALADGFVERDTSETAMHVACVGKPLAAHTVFVVDEHGEAVSDGEVGHIVASGPSIMKGYFEDPEATQKVLRDGLLWTGDLGFRTTDGLYITGRSKDLIIVRGKNFYAEDIEHHVEGVPGLRPGGVVAFAVYDEERARDAVVCVCETRVTDESERTKLAGIVTERVSEQYGLALEEVVLVEPGTIPKTSSGKRQRSLTRDRYLDDTLYATRTGKLGIASVFVRSAIGFIALAGRKMAGKRRRPDTE